MVLWKLVDWPITIPWFSTDISLLEWRYGHLPIYTYIYIYVYIYIITIYIYTLTFDYGTVKSSKLTEPIILTRNHGKLVLNARVFQASSETRCSNHWKTKQQEDIGRPCPIGGRSTVSIYHHLSPFITIYHHLSPFILANIGELVPFYEQLCRLCRRRLIMGTLAMFFGCPLWTSEASSLSIWNPLGATFFSSRLQHTRWCLQL